MLFALADIAGWIARKLEIFRGMLDPSPFCSMILSCGAFSVFHRLLDFPKHRIPFAAVCLCCVSNSNSVIVLNM